MDFERLRSSKTSDQEMCNLFENRWNSIQVSILPDLPYGRVSEDPPLTHVGLYFVSPLNVDNGNPDENNSTKVYIYLFTCASTRAVHLELSKSLNVQGFLLTSRRFTSRRRLPATLTSDNARTFKSSSKEIRKITTSNEVVRYLDNNNVYSIGFR